MFSKTLISAFGLFAAANAHFAISSPDPIPGSGIKDPLDPSGSNFPCHGVDMTQGSVTPLKVGSSFPIQFNLGNGANTAVHGGGSCQVALTYETSAAKLKDPASWKVIKTFLGGCPTDAKGNLPSAVMCPGGKPDCVNQLGFDVPAEVKNGDAILAFTWFNNIGNREMYMNCAKVSVSGGSSSDSGLSSLPSLFVANLASINQCKTTEQYNTDIPNAGKYVQTDSTLNYPLKAPAGSGCSSGSSSGSGSGSAPAASYGSGSSGSGATSPAASAAAPAASANNGQYAGVGAASSRTANGVIGASPTAKAASNPGGIFAPGAAAGSAGTGAVATTLATVAVPAATAAASSSSGTVQPADAAPAQAAASPAQAAASPAQAASGGVAGAVPCTASGFYCIDATHFGMCNFGYAIPQAMAAGTNCVNGAVKAINVKRSTHRHLRHLHNKSF